MPFLAHAGLIFGGSEAGMVLKELAEEKLIAEMKGVGYTTYGHADVIE